VTDILALRTPDEVASSSYGFSIMKLSGESLITLGSLLGFVLFFLFYLGLVDYVCSALRIDRRAAFTIAIPGLLIAAAIGGGSLAFVVVTGYGFGLAMAAIGTAGYSAGLALGNRSCFGVLLAIGAVADVVLSFVLPEVAEVALMLGVLALFLNFPVVFKLHQAVSSIAPIFGAMLSPPVLGVAMISSIVLAPAISRNWHVIQAVSLFLPLVGGLVVALEDRS
jgi:hypothetical protein